MPIVTRKHRKRPSKHLKRIRAAVQAGKWKKANWLIVEWLRSPEAKRLAVRLARRKMKCHCRPHKSELDAIAEHLDPWKGSNEDVFVVNIPKENNPYDVRQTMAFGIENRALQYLVLLVLRELVELHPSQYQTNPYGPRGTHPAIERVKKALSDGYVWAIEYDIKDCYPSFNGKELSNFLPLPKKVIEAVLLCEHLNLKGGYSLLHKSRSLYASGSVVCEKGDEEGLLNDQLVRARRGIPQGSAASPFVAEALLSPTLYQIPKIGVIVAYADNILLLAKTKGDAASMTETLGRVLKTHLAGPFYSKTKSFDAGQPIEFLGHKLTLKANAVHIEPDDQNLEKFTHWVESELAYLNKSTLPSSTRKKKIERLESAISGWANGGFKLCDNVKALRTQWLAQANAQGNEALESVSEEQKPVTNTIKKTFKLHPDQMEIVEDALGYAKRKSGTKSDTVALEYVCQEVMGSGLSFNDAKSALTAEYKKAADAFLFLERVGNWLEEILGKKVTVSVSK
jgi:Reverse transcriptase (RNA-dependent DNA polymerase)